MGEGVGGVVPQKFKKDKWCKRGENGQKMWPFYNLGWVMV